MGTIAAMKICHYGPGRASFGIYMNASNDVFATFSFAHPRDEYKKSIANRVLHGRKHKRDIFVARLPSDMKLDDVFSAMAYQFCNTLVDLGKEDWVMRVVPVRAITVTAGRGAIERRRHARRFNKVDTKHPGILGAGAASKHTTTSWPQSRLRTEKSVTSQHSSSNNAQNVERST